MFIKLESDAGPNHPETTQTLQCQTYTLVEKPTLREKHLQTDPHSPTYVIRDDPGQWNRAYVMNDRGDTIEHIRAFPAEGSEKGVRHAG